MYTVVLGINTLFCLLIGFLLAFNPALWSIKTDPLVTAWVRCLGFAYIPLGALSLILIFLKTKELYVTGFAVMAIFHMGLTVALSLNYLASFSTISPVLAHAVLAIAAIAGVLKASKGHFTHHHH